MNKTFYKIFISVLILGFYTVKCQVNSWELNGQKILQIGEKYTSLFYKSKLDSLISYILDPNYKLSELTIFREQIETQLGVELSVLNIQYFPSDPTPWLFITPRSSPKNILYFSFLNKLGTLKIVNGLYEYKSL